MYVTCKARTQGWSGVASFNEATSAWEAPAGTYKVHFAASVADIRATADYRLKKDQRWPVNNVLAPAEPINELKINEIRF